MRRRPEEDEVLKELMGDMMSMDKERLDKKRHGPSITIAIGMPKKEEEGEEEMGEGMEMENESPIPMEEPKPEMEAPGESAPSWMEDMELDPEEQALVDEAKSLGIKEPEYMDLRLLKKLVEKKRGAATV